MGTQLNWRSDGGIVAYVPEDTLPECDLPPEATRIQLDGKAAFHVTLIGRRMMEPRKDEMMTFWALSLREQMRGNTVHPIVEFVHEKFGFSRD